MIPCIPLSAVCVDFPDVLPYEEMRKFTSMRNRPKDYWTVDILKAKTYEEYLRLYKDIDRFAKELPIEFGEKKTTVLVYAPNKLEAQISNDTYVLYTWMLMNLLCPLDEHVKAKFKFDLDALV